MAPLRRDERSSSESGEDLEGSSKRSPSIIAREKLFLECSFVSLSKTGGNCPEMAPMTTLEYYY